MRRVEVYVRPHRIFPNGAGQLALRDGAVFLAPVLVGHCQGNGSAVV